MTTRAEAVAAYPALRLFIDGEWLGEGSLPVVDPSTEAELGRLPAVSAAELDRAFAAAERAWPAWRRVPALERARLILRAVAWLRERREEWAALITLELGKPLAQARLETDTACEMFEWAAEECRRLYGRQVPSRTGTMRMTASIEPIGPVAAIGGWNAPAITPARKIAGAIAAGCTIVMKPSEATPASALMIARAFEAVGLPNGVVNMVFGDPPTIGTAFATDPRIRMLTFTGGGRVGKMLAAQATDTLKRVVLELGGHAPAMIFADCDAEAVAKAAATAKFRNSGQICTSPTRFLVERSIHDRFLAAFGEAAAAIRVGDPFEDGVAMGPLQNARRRSDIAALVDDARERGATVRQGVAPSGAGFFHPPTLLSGLDPAARALNEEPFGPIALVVPMDDVDAIIAEANRMSFALASYAFTNDLRLAERLGREIEAGTLAINHWQASWPETPFGGWKESGVGLEGAAEGLMAFCQTRFVSVQSGG
ncbi:MAG: NAD-dependent succinate-semialdehyde dehydrogenase [Sphingomonadaceae bacterium]|nr:NAD-dependent succinate-semialdehyde dehydrogenase [Sphingomonadaceae bacterium]